MLWTPPASSPRFQTPPLFLLPSRPLSLSLHPPASPDAGAGRMAGAARAHCTDKAEQLRITGCLLRVRHRPPAPYDGPLVSRPGCFDVCLAPGYAVARDRLAAPLPVQARLREVCVAVPYSSVHYPVTHDSAGGLACLWRRPRLISGGPCGCKNGHTLSQICTRYSRQPLLTPDT